MTRVVKRSTAADDMLDIWLYIAPENIAAADQSIDRIDGACARLALAPSIGSMRDDLMPGLRSLALGRYILFYRPLNDGIELVRVLHGARDIAAIFDGEP